MVSPSILRRILLLGLRNTARAAKPGVFHRIFSGLVEVLQFKDQVYVSPSFVSGFCADTEADEENALIRFFGQAYVDYRSKAGTMIPFIP